MDWFDDIQIEEFQADFVEEICEELFVEDEDSKLFESYLKSNYDYWQYVKWEDLSLVSY